MTTVLLFDGGAGNRWARRPDVTLMPKVRFPYARLGGRARASVYWHAERSFDSEQER